MIGILYTDSKMKYGMSLNKKPYYLFKPSQKEKYGCIYYVPYENKVQPKRYVLIEPDPDNVKYGKLIQVIGIVGDIVSEYEHLLYYHNLFQSSWKIKKEEIPELPDVNYRVFTIDPYGCIDRDDAFHIQKKKEYYEIGVHIASPTVYLDNHSWQKALHRVSTIYMPHRKINMIPTLYADNICSFVEGEKRHAITILYKVHIEHPYDWYEEPMVCESVVFNKKAYTYEEYDTTLSKKKDLFYRLSSSLFKKEINDSHLLVEQWMIQTNQYMAKYMSQHFPKHCILRVHEAQESLIDDGTLAHYLQRRESKSARYEYYKSDSQTHSLCNDLYTHFTSPIRRSVDLWNHLVLRGIIQEEIIDLDFIHSFMKRMKKMQRNSQRIEIIERILYKGENKGEKRKEYYDAYLIEIILSPQHVPRKGKIYIPEFNMEESILFLHPTLEKELPTIDSYPKYTLYQKLKVQMYIFQDADVLFQKIKWKVYCEEMNI